MGSLGRATVTALRRTLSLADEITSPTWSLAHTSQFAPIGWRYARHGAGVGLFPSGGSYVTRVSPDMHDFSIVIEKMDYKTSGCARGKNPMGTTTAENATFVLKGAFLAAAKAQGSLQVWYSDLTDGNDSPSLFLKRAPVTVDPGSGAFTLSLRPGELYTVTTLTTGSKGNHTVPAHRGMQLPYLQTFEDETEHAPPRLWYDIFGAWEVHDSGDPARGKVMRQMTPIWPAGWHGPPHHGPTTYFGPGDPRDTIVKPGVRVSFGIWLDADAELSLTVGEPAGKGNPNPGKNLALSIDSLSGNWTCGDSAGTGARFAAGAWHNVSLSMPGSQKGGGGGGGGAQLSLNGTVLGSTGKGAIGSLQVVLSRYIFAMIDDFSVVVDP